MLKSIRTTMKLDREKVRIPRRVQDAIPVKAVYEDGIFQLAKNKYRKSWKFTDINYDVLSDEERIETIKSYGVLLNSFESSATTKITIHNRRISQKDFGERILLEEKDDGMNRYRREYNEMLQAKAAGNNAILQEKYITVSVHKNSLEEARGFFRRAGTELASRLGKLGSRCQELDGLDHAVQFRISGHAEPGSHRPTGAGKAAAHLRAATCLYHRCTCRPRAAEGEKQPDTIRKSLPEEYGTLPIDDHEAFR